MPDDLRVLSDKAAAGPWFVCERPTDEGLAVIEDGRAHGLFPITAEWPEARLIAAAVNFVRQALATAPASPGDADRG